MKGSSSLLKNKKGELEIFLFSDIHFGNSVKIEEIGFIINTILSNINDKNNSIVIFSGDYFERKLNIDSEQSRLAFQLLKDLDNIGIPVCLINGTYSHDHNYIDTLNEIEYKNLNFIKTQEEKVININGINYSFLFLPEEYSPNQFEFYKDSLYNENKFFDIIVFHGTILGLARYNQTKESVPISGAPLFDKDFISSKAHLVLSGHIHAFQTYKNIIISGSLSRNSHGEEEKKFVHKINFSKKNKKFNISSFENTFATKFSTFIIKFDRNLQMNDFGSIELNLINTETKEIKNLNLYNLFDYFKNDTERIRFIFDFEGIPSDDSLKKYIKDNSNNYSHITVLLRNTESESYSFKETLMLEEKSLIQNVLDFINTNSPKNNISEEEIKFYLQK